MSHLTQKPKIFFGLLMLVVKWESLLTRVMAAYGGLVFGKFFSKQTNGQNIWDIFEQTFYVRRTFYVGRTFFLLEADGNFPW